METKPQLEQLAAYVPGRSVEMIKKAYQLDEIYKLASNENPFGCSKKVSKAIHAFFKEPNIYPDGSATDLRIAVAEHLNVGCDQLLFGAGVDEVIQMVSRALLLPGDNIVQADFTFPQYAHHAVIEGAAVKKVALVDGVHNLPGMLQAIDEKTKIVWVCNPNNPTGTIVEQGDLLDFVKQVPKHVLVVLDKAYYEYVTHQAYPQTIPWVEEYENIMVLRTFSKAYGLAAYRIGYAVMRKRLLEKINVARLPHQSIYKFRGATIKNILEFEKEYENAETIRLEQNYRSTTNILSAANEVIACNKRRKGKKLWTDNGEGDKIQIYTGDTQDEEAEYIAKEILKGYENGKKLSDFTILYRSHVLSNGVETAFKRHGIQYRIVSGLRFFDRAEIKDVLAYLWLVSNPNDTVRLKRIINVPSRKIGAKTLEGIDTVAANLGISHFEVCQRADEFLETAKSADTLKAFAHLIDKFKAKSTESSISELYEDVLMLSGYHGMLTAKDDKESREIGRASCRKEC